MTRAFVTGKFLLQQVEGKKKFFCYCGFFNSVVEHFLGKHLAGSVFSVFQSNSTRTTSMVQWRIVTVVLSFVTGRQSV
jgi:hypothetical protein